MYVLVKAKNKSLNDNKQRFGSLLGALEDKAKIGHLQQIYPSNKIISHLKEVIVDLVESVTISK